MIKFSKAYFHIPSKEELESSVYITWAGHRKYAHSYHVGPKTNEHYNIILVIGGKGILKIEDEVFEIKTGDLFMLFPGVKHYYCADPEDPWEIMWTSFNGKACADIMKSMNITPEYPVIHGVSLDIVTQVLTNIIIELENNVSAYALKATGLLYILFSELLPFTKKISERKILNVEQYSIKKAVTFIDVNYYNTMNVDTLCQYVNLSRSHFSRLFKKEVKLSVPEYINKVRIYKAKLLLKETDLSINEVAKSVGFNDQFYFSKVFKDLEGQSPSIYKKLYLKNKFI